LPAEIRPYFQKHRGFIVEHAIDPDLWRTVDWVEEPPQHFLDMDAFGPAQFDTLPTDIRRSRSSGATWCRKTGCCRGASTRRDSSFRAAPGDHSLLILALRSVFGAGVMARARRPRHSCCG
jgi:hypothetical protein